jgi:hypothetical protein
MGPRYVAITISGCFLMAVAVVGVVGTNTPLTYHLVVAAIRV